jgi:5-methyltetrahydropteroyltriglutamate--homocysteine methyltransferase
MTTHVGSLPRPPALRTLLLAHDRGEEHDAAELTRATREAVHDAVTRQVQIGIDLVSDGEMGKIAYSLYPKERLAGFAGEAGPRPQSREAADFPDWARQRVPVMQHRPICRGPISLASTTALRTDIGNFSDAVQAAAPRGAFMTAASPGVIAAFIPNEYYPSHEAYVHALGEAMRAEYEAIVAAGFILQLDCPDLALRHNLYATDNDLEWARRCSASIDALNAATAAIPAQRMRLHLCWGNYEGPHHYDLPLEDVLPRALRARPTAISFEGANPRHEHEWEFFRSFRLPDDKVIVPGVIDSTTNFIEHPRLVAQRIERYAQAVGPERVVAGVDCGFATTAEYSAVDGEIAWAKLETLARGAELASTRL